MYLEIRTLAHRLLLVTLAVCVPRDEADS